MLVGSAEQKLLIAFKCFDQDGNELIEKDEVKLILKNIPSLLASREGLSFQSEEASVSRNDLITKQMEDSKQIIEFTECLFQEFPDGLYFDEFVYLAKSITSELVYSIYHAVYQCVPCA